MIRVICLLRKKSSALSAWAENARRTNARAQAADLMRAIVAWILHTVDITSSARPREGGDPDWLFPKDWIPACAGMSGGGASVAAKRPTRSAGPRSGRRGGAA